MKKVQVKIKRLSGGAKIPIYSTDEAAACDLFADFSSLGEDCTEVTINPGEIKLIPCGIQIECEKSCDYLLSILLFSRSGLATRHGITMANGVGVVDEDYRGEIKVPLINLSAEPYSVKQGERVAQMMFVPTLRAEFEESSCLSSTERGEGGFGSTGRV